MRSNSVVAVVPGVREQIGDVLRRGRLRVVEGSAVTVRVWGGAGLEAPAFPEQAGVVRVVSDGVDKGAGGVFCQLVVAGNGKAAAVGGAGRPGQRREVPEKYGVEGLDQVGAGQAGLRYLPTNLSMPEIANELSVSHNTIRTHMRHMYAKLGTHRRADTVARARDLGLLASSPRDGPGPVS